jgi:pyruvate ferredoxin oxidoreductase gamma subunit
VKTASRILGTAAFLRGWQAQDSPVYGAERRGAAIAAFTRLDAEPIRERGVVRDPDLILVADETLLADPAAGVLAGGESASAVFVNSDRAGSALAPQFHIPCPVITLDLTTLTAERLGRGSALSAAVGAVACALVGVSAEVTADAVREELAELQLPRELVEKNVELALLVHGRVPAATLRPRPSAPVPSALHPPAYALPPEGMAVITAPGNSAVRHTGSWRLFRPTIDHDICTRCGICFVRCPDSAISLDAEGYPVIDHDNCKGCMICREECPLKCIHEEREVRAW